MSRIKRLIGVGVLLSASLAISLVVTELALRMLIKPPQGYSMLLPGSMVFQPDSRYVHGIEGPARYDVNAAGYRGPPFGADAREYRILLVGGSTTECTLLDISENWGTIVQQNLVRTSDGRSAWVGNVGRSGLTARDHAVTVKYLLPQYPRIDLVVVLAGVNDLTAALRQGENYERPKPITAPEAERLQIRNAFMLSPHGFRRPILESGAREKLPWYKDTRLYDLARRARLGKQARSVVEQIGGTKLEQWRSHRRQASAMIDRLPDLEAPLDEYRSNLRAIVKAARSGGSDVVFLTQPSLWKPNITPEEERLLWLGGTGSFQEEPGHAYYTVSALSEAISRYNATMMEFCRVEGLNCFDLAAAVPQDTTLMYDDVHFTEAGSALVGRLVAQHLRSVQPRLFSSPQVATSK
jgi:lysophospholipase L1-like esterase